MRSPELPFRGGLDQSVTHDEAERMGLLLSDREVLESMTPGQLLDFILAKGERVAEIERIMSLASDVLEGAYGTTVEQLLNERNKNEQQT